MPHKFVCCVININFGYSIFQFFQYVSASLIPRMGFVFGYCFKAIYQFIYIFYVLFFLL